MSEVGNRSVEELLGLMCDMAVKVRSQGFGKEAIWFCVYCGDKESNPMRVRHKHNCLVAQAKHALLKVHYARKINKTTETRKEI